MSEKIVQLNEEEIKGQIKEWVGGSVGLSPLWTLLAALLGGKLFGIIGIVFFIPLAAVISQLLQGDIEQRLTAREKMKPEK